MKNITESWKTTLIGIILFIGALAYLFISTYLKMDANYIIISILLASGIGMLFSPDTLISKLNDLIDKKSKEV